MPQKWGPLVSPATVNGVFVHGFVLLYCRYTDVLYYSLSRGRVAIDAVDGLGRSLLFVAAVHQRHATVEFLLENAALFDLDHLAASGFPPRFT